MSPLIGPRMASLLAILSGLLLWAAFPPVGIGLSAALGVALLSAATWRASIRRGLAMGAVSGLAFFLPLLEWMHVIGLDAWIGLSVFCAVWMALLGAALALVTRLPLAAVWVACLWVLEEALRGRIPWGGFPWGNLAFAQADTIVGDWSPVVGLPMVTFAVALLGAAGVALLVAARGGALRPALAWAAVMLAVVLVPLAVPARAGGDDVGGESSATVALVQGGTPQVGMGAMDVRRAVLDNHVRETMNLAEAIAAGTAAQPDFVLWPENSTDIDPFADPFVADDITAAAQAVGAPIVVGAVTGVPGNPDGAWNVGIVWDPESGPSDMYIKNHPVPFGEYIPFREQLAGIIGRFDRIPRDFIAGDDPGNLDVGGVAVGNVICFEIAYGQVVDAVVDGGARLLTVQTNNATYGGTSQPAQQLAITRMRASETGRTVVVAATSGISAVIDTDRRLQQQLTQEQTGWLVAEVPLYGRDTPATRFGHLLELVACAAGVVAVAVALVRSRRPRPVPSPPEPDESIA